MIAVRGEKEPRPTRGRRSRSRNCGLGGRGFPATLPPATAGTLAYISDRLAALIEARKFSGLAIDTLVELTKDSHTDSTRYSAATALLDRGYGRPAQSLDLHLSADAITKRLSDMTDAELAALEARMITIPAALALENADKQQANGDTDAAQDGDGCADDEAAGNMAAIQSGGNWH